MALWEYKVITSGPHGFASPSLLEAHLNALGKDEWEIIQFQTLPNNPLAFNGLARRSTTRDWVPPEAPAAAPKPLSWDTPPAKPNNPPEEKPALPPALAETAEAPVKADEAKMRTVRDTERDQDPEALAEEEDWDNWEEEQEELPTLFEAVKPHLRRNQRGPGMSVALDYLAKRWEQKEADIVGALKECGFTVPETEEADPDYFEFEGDLYWVNRNNRGQLFLNTREKPRPRFRVAPVAKLDPNDPAAAELATERAEEKAEMEKRNTERADRQAAQAAAAAARAAAREQARAAAPEAAAVPAEGTPAPESGASAEPLPSGQALLERIHPHMRRNRRGPGHSGSVAFLARALHTNEADLVAGLAALNLNVPANPNDKPVYVEIGRGVYWLNKDSRGGIWINGREKRDSDRKPEGTPTVPAAPAAETHGDKPAVPAEVVVAAVVEAVASGALSKPEEPSAPAEAAPVKTEPVSSDSSETSDQAAEEKTDEAEKADGDSAEKKDSKAPKAKKPSRPRAPRKPRKPKAE